jgi:spore maturation protein CgeB
MPPNVHYAGHLFTADHNAFNASALAILNVSRDSMAAYGYSPATRVFEAAGAGACIITDSWEGIGEFFEPGREILVAASGPEVAEHLARLTPEQARRIGEAARARALAEHPYVRRVRLVEDVLAGRRS